MPRKNINNKLLELKKTKKRKENVDNNKENVYEKIIIFSFNTLLIA